MSANKVTCKEVNSKCKCIVKEKAIKNNDDTNDKQKKTECKATIYGVINFPEAMCCNNNKKKEDVKKDDCSYVYGDLGECLQRCILKTSKKEDGANIEC